METYYKIVPILDGSYTTDNRQLSFKGKNYFSSLEEALKHYRFAESVAKANFDSIVQKLSGLREGIDFEFEHLNDADSKLVVVIREQGYKFKFTYPE